MSIVPKNNRGSILNPLIRKQRELNLTTREQWAFFAEHRSKVTSLLSGEQPARKLCVLGAGNCNDIDLRALMAAFDEVHLMDFDGESLAEGVRRQVSAPTGSLFLHGDFDVSGQVETISTWTPSKRVSDDELAAIKDGPRLDESLTTGIFDVVASTCVFSQIIGGTLSAIGEKHPQVVEIIQALRHGHLSFMARLAKPGGRMCFISDVVSSASCPELAWVSDHDLDSLLTQCLRTKNFFTGTNPLPTLAMLRTGELASLIESVAGVRPWRWNCGERTYLVYAINARRRGG